MVMAVDDNLRHPKSDADILKKVQQFRSDGAFGSANFIDRMRKAEDFVIGEQWEPGIKAAARAKGKFTLTIPIIKAQVNQIAGEEILNPQDFIVKNTKGGSASIARIITALVKQAADSERARYEKSHAFKSGLSSGQGCIGVFKDKTKDPKHANLRIERLVEHDTLVDPNATSYDINKPKTGAKYVIWEEWVDKEMVELEYPEKKNELSSTGSRSFLEITAGNVRAIINMMVGGRTSRETGMFGHRERADIKVLTKNRYLVSHTWWREPKKCVHWFDNRESELDSQFLHKDKEIKLAKDATKKSPKIFSIEEVNCNIMHHTITVGDTFLEDRNDEFNGVDRFPILFYWPYWINGYKSGIAEDLISTQEEINFTHSMAMNIVKLMGNKAFKIRSDPTKTKAKWLADHAGDNNLVLNEDDFGGSVEQLDPNPFPAQAIEAFTKSSMDNVKTITGRLDIPERDPKVLSGRAKLLDIQKTQQGSMSILLNWNYTLTMMGDLIVEIIRKNDIFSEEEIRATVDKEDLLDPEILEAAKGIVFRQIQEQGGKIPNVPEQPNPILTRTAPPAMQAEMIDAFKREMDAYKEFVNQVEALAIPIAESILMNMIHNMKVGEYNTKVVISPMAETMRVVKAQEVFALQEVLRQSGDVGLNAEDLIDATDVANKDELKEGRRELIGAVQAAQPDVSISRSA